jgi:hypothetical protein
MEYIMHAHNLYFFFFFTWFAHWSLMGPRHFACSVHIFLVFYLSLSEWCNSSTLSWSPDILILPLPMLLARISAVVFFTFKLLRFSFPEFQVHFLGFLDFIDFCFFYDSLSSTFYLFIKILSEFIQLYAFILFKFSQMVKHVILNFVDHTCHHSLEFLCWDFIHFTII